ncbi:MAG TPA: protease SohB [Candidatus Acidoferrum sp.]|nr:protease SohB [Candidatus Acidoferrum sp.]
MQFLTDYGLFLAKTITLVLAFLFVVLMILANSGRQRQDGKPKGHISAIKLNDEIDLMKDDIRHAVLDEDTLKQEEKDQKKKDKAERKAKQQALKDATGTGETVDDRKRIYVLNFDGDVAASAVEDLRQTITAVLQVARCGLDEVMLRLESPGGLVHAYGLAASQLVRLRKHNIPLTVCVDKVAASGGYMMACIANRLIAAPFAYIGSIGVIVQLPNVHRLLKQHNVDYEMISAGEYKRTLSTFGENTDAGRAKVQEEVNEMHQLFKDFISEYRPAVDLATVATGEVWSGLQALPKGLIDELDTSDEWLVAKCKDADVYEVTWEHKRKLADRLSSLLELSLGKALQSSLLQWMHRSDKEKFF